MRILFLGDIVGKAGRSAVIEQITDLVTETGADFVIANGENTAEGRGITLKIAISLMKTGISVITTGDHIWDQPELAKDIEHEPRLLRPVNYPEGTPGSGWVIVPTNLGKVGVVSLQGLAFMNPLIENPFIKIEQIIAEIRKETKVIFVDFHAETTSEKCAMGWLLNGKVSAVVGTHTHVPTADARILPAVSGNNEPSTAFMCDVGMCGPADSVLGRDYKAILRRFKSGMPHRFPVASGRVIICGVTIDIDVETGSARSIEPLQKII